MSVFHEKESFNAFHKKTKKEEEAEASERREFWIDRASSEFNLIFFANNFRAVQRTNEYRNYEAPFTSSIADDVLKFLPRTKVKRLIESKEMFRNKCKKGIASRIQVRREISASCNFSTNIGISEIN